MIDKGRNKLPVRLRANGAGRETAMGMILYEK